MYTNPILLHVSLIINFERPTLAHPQHKVFVRSFCKHYYLADTSIDVGTPSRAASQPASEVDSTEQMVFSVKIKGH